MAPRRTAAASPTLAAERLQLVLRLGQRISSMLDVETLLPEACHLIAEAFGYDTVGINLRDPLHERRLYQAAAYPPDRLLPRSFRLSVERGLTGWVARNGRPRLVNDVARDPRYVPGPGRSTRSELDVPLKVAGRTIGVLNVESERVDAFAEHDVPYLEGLAGQLAQAIENARLAAQARELAAAEERARLARDLHDETIQALVAIARQVDLLALDLDDPPRARERVEAIHGQVERTLQGVRRLSRNLRPAVLQDLGLVPAIRAHAEELAPLGLRVDVRVGGHPSRLPAPVEEAVYRVTQEALSNALRHAAADRATVELDFSPREFVLVVADTGRGFDADRRPAPGEGQGLVGMRDRAARIGAELSVRSRPGRGTTVRLLVPLAVTVLERP